MFSKHETDKKNIFVNAIKVDKKKESKTTPHVSAKISAYDRVVQIVDIDTKKGGQTYLFILLVRF